MMILAFRLQPLNRFSLPVLLNLLEQAGFDQFFKIIIVENENQLAALLKSDPCGILIYSFLTPQLPEVAEELSRLNANRPAKLKLMVGGAHATGDPVSCLKLGFDYVYTGPAETGFVPVLEEFLSRGLPSEKIIYSAEPLQNLDLSMPVSKYIKTMPPLEITRGCYWSCSFCQTACEKAIHRSMDSIKLYYTELKKKNFHRRMDFICPSAFEYGAESANKLSYSSIQDLLKFCKENGSRFIEFGIFPSEARPNTFSEEYVELITRYCSNKKLTIGAQSGSDRQLKLMRRGHSIADVENACKITAKYKLKPIVDFIFGFPGENRDDRKLSLELIKHLANNYQARVQVHYFLPLSGTPLADSQPTDMDYRCIDTLRKYQKDGICTGWWEHGQKLAKQIIAVREQLQNIKINYISRKI